MRAVVGVVGGDEPMKIEKADRAQSSNAGAVPESTVPDEQSELIHHFEAGLARAGVAVVVVDLEDETVRAVTEAGRRLLGLPSEGIIGRPWMDLVVPSERSAAAAALEALRTGAIDFYRARRSPVKSARHGEAFSTWGMRIEIGGKAYLVGYYYESRVPPGSGPTGPEVFSRAVALAITDARGAIKSGAMSPDAQPDFSFDTIRTTRLVPVAKDGKLVSLTNWRAARSDAVSIAYQVTIRNAHGLGVELDAVAAALAGSADWLVVLLTPDAPSRRRETELEGHLWRIGAEIEASGILLHAGSTPGLSLARIPEAAGLTPRQWEVLRRIVAGQRVPTIASELYLSQSTIRNHLSAIFERFGVHSQAQLLARLMPSGVASI
jgi:DNA-binding CsgD family transcriptional regulator/PAS domain-containing protein